MLMPGSGADGVVAAPLNFSQANAVLLFFAARGLQHGGHIPQQKAQMQLKIHGPDLSFLRKSSRPSLIGE